jgi:hypothetical protein
VELPPDLVANLRRIGARLIYELPSEEVPSLGVMGLRKFAQQWKSRPGWTQYDMICICAALVLQIEYLERKGAL